MTQKCDLPPVGWYCTREPGHEGPCPTHPEDTTVYNMAISQWGHAAQASQAQEELAELIVAISKCFFRGKNIEDSGIVGELADVLIVVNQLIYMLDVKDQVDDVRKFKLERLMNRILDAQIKSLEVIDA